ncbi:MAG TPA: hypothetical protein VN258_06445 [Mobilitalea sp.]|nr:hypothetical protein [Mobilitalea sp.]
MSKGNFKVRGLKNWGRDIVKGKIYEYVNGNCTYDNGWESRTYDSFSELMKCNPETYKGILEEVKENQTIVIYHKDLETIASLKSGKKVIRSASAKCNPADTYDFEVGAKLAINRLLGVPVDSRKVKEAVKSISSYRIVKQDKYEAGDKVKVREDLASVVDTKGAGVMEEMHCQAGKIVTITSVYKNYPCKFNIDADTWTWSTDMIEGKVIENTIKATQFDWSAFKSGKFAVHCNAEEKAREFLKECDVQGIKWCSGKASSETHWKSYKEKTIYTFSFGTLGYCDIGGLADLTNHYTIIDYIPTKPAVKEVSRKAKAGEYVKIVNSQYTPTSKIKYENGDILKITRVDDLGARYGEGSCEWLYHDEYVVLEGYVPVDKPTIKEVHRPAKVGEWIKVIDKSGHSVKVGTIGKVTSLYSDGVYVNGDVFGSARLLLIKNYVVLENYQPEDKPLEMEEAKAVSKPTDSKAEQKEVKRQGKIGEYIKIVKANPVGIKYNNGDVFKVVLLPSGNCGVKVNIAGEKEPRCICNSEYVVLENYQSYSKPEEPKPFVKAKVGDKIKVVKKYEYHSPDVMGNTYTVNEVDRVGVWADDNNIYFWDKNAEYIIIEKAKPEPVKTPLSGYLISKISAELLRRYGDTK